ncbi:MAG TPA: hypothetical protein PKI14_08465 [Fervidobacterium sp.]|jgi:hypothetical protein|nr:hypothetical protein [Fervidobacterium sp.]HUM42967.1 hypothetical protein [Fervidobacterium sp.]
MVDSLEINQLIMETIHENSPNESVVQIIREVLQYELDIWNRYVPKREILDQYELIVNRNIKELIK